MINLTCEVWLALCFWVVGRCRTLWSPAVTTLVDWLTNSSAELVVCWTQGTTLWWEWGWVCTFALSASPGWSGQRAAGSGVQAQCWAEGWCGWRTCRRGFQKTVPSWTLALETPRQQLPLRDSRPELSWHKHGRHSRTSFQKPGEEGMSVQECNYSNTSITRKCTESNTISCSLHSSH